MKQMPTLLAAIAAMALVLACSKGTEAPSAPGSGEAPADAGAAPAEARPMGEAVGHYHPKGKLPSKHTMAVLEKARASLPFADKPATHRDDFAERLSACGALRRCSAHQFSLYGSRCRCIIQYRTPRGWASRRPR